MQLSPAGPPATVQRTDQPRPSAPARSLDPLRLRAGPPAVPAGFVCRQRLTERLTAGAAHPVTLISAGAGYGKTLTLASWARSGQAPGTVAWLTMDRTDNDLQAFWTNVLGALTISGAVPADSPLSEVSPAAEFGPRQTDLVRTHLASLPGVVTLVLDDFHTVRDPKVLESFAQLLEHQPRQLRLVLSTRFDPPLRLHRLRVNGEVTDIRAADLAFTASEAAEFFDTNAIHLSGDQLRTVCDRTQGWAAGLRLSLMSLDRADLDGAIARFAGSTPLVMEYLIEEVIDRLPATDRRFLLSASIADRMSVSLANELTGRRDGQVILERLAAQHALVVRLAGDNDWYSLHPLLRQMLRHKLAAEQPEAVAELHLRASRWFAAHGEPIPAIRYATGAEAWDEVTRLAALALPLMLTPNAAALVAALTPAAAMSDIEPNAGTLLASAMIHFYRHDYESMMRDVEDAAELVPADSPKVRSAADLIIATLRVVHARVRNPARINRAADDLLTVVDRTPRRELPTVDHFRIIAENNIALGQLWSGRLDEAERSLHRVQMRSQEHSPGFGPIECAGPSRARGRHSRTPSAGAPGHHCRRGYGGPQGVVIGTAGAGHLRRVRPDLSRVGSARCRREADRRRVGGQQQRVRRGMPAGAGHCVRRRRGGPPQAALGTRRRRCVGRHPGGSR